MSRKLNRSLPPVSYQVLEERRLLASTLYVDFGFGAGSELSVSDTDSASLNGPEVFGDSYDLASYASIMISQGVEDQNDDSVVDQLDVQVQTDRIFEELVELFSPFDINVVKASATDLADIQASLNSTSTNDAYVFVGGQKPGTVYRPSDGAAVRDAGNVRDNLAFVFPVEANSSSFTNLSVVSEYRRQMTRAIAQQAGTTWGLQRVEGSAQLAANEVMALPGTDADANLLMDNRDAYDRSFFTRAKMEAMQFRGNSPGTQNSFDLLASTVGLANDAVYFTVTGLDDSINVTIVGENLVDVEVNGELFSSVDTTNGLVFLGTGIADDTISLRGEAIQLTMRDHLANANENIEIRNIETIRTGEQDDVITIDGLFTNIYTGDGDDTINWQAAPDPENPANYGFIYGEAGDDQLVFLTAQRLREFHGGEGFDRVDLSALESTTQYLLGSSENGITLGFLDFDKGIQFLAGVEQLTGSDSGESTIQYGYSMCLTHFCDSSAPISKEFIVTEIDGDTTTYSDPNFEVPLVFENFDSAVGNQVFVLSLNRDIEIDADNVQLSSNQDFQLGTTAGFDGKLTVNNASLFVVSNVNGEEASEITMFEDETSSRLIIGGVTSGDIEVDADRVVVHGSDRLGDFFRIESLNRELYVQGHGGDDRFNLGDGTTPNGGNFENYKMVPHLFAGEGNDVLSASDFSGSGKDFSYLLNDNWVTNSPDSRGYGTRDFPGIYHRDLEKVQVLGTEDRNIFRVTPSSKITYFIDGNSGENPRAKTDRLQLVGDVPEDRSFISREGQGEGTWWFGAAEGKAKLIAFKSIEEVGGVGRLALSGKAPTGQAQLSVFDARTNRNLFNRNVFTTTATDEFRVATGNLGVDTIPDIVVAPGKKHHGRVFILEGENGGNRGSFLAFDPPYNSGVDVAVANVLGDDRNEIIVSTLHGENLIRVFAEFTPYQFVEVLTYSPFPAGTPKVGVRIATADMNWDGVDDIIAVPGPGWRPQVAIHDVSSGSDAQQVSRFLAYVPNYRGGLNVAVGDMLGNRRPEIIIGAGITQRPSNPFSGQFRVFRGETLPRDAGGHVVSPIYSVDAYSGTRQVNVSTIDLDGDGRIDRIFTSVANEVLEEDHRRINVFTTDGKPESLTASLYVALGMQVGVDLGS